MACVICASARDESLFCGVPIETRAASPRSEALEDDKRWFDEKLAVSLTHSRIRVGCWSTGWKNVSCSTFRGESFYGVLPHLTDQETARRFAMRMLHSSRPEQFQLLEDCVRVRCRTLEDPGQVGFPRELLERLASCRDR